MEKYVMLIILFILSPKIFSQVSISGKIVDSKTKRTIENVYIQNRNIAGSSSLTQEDGSFSIEGDSSNIFDLYRVGYTSASYVYNGEQIVEIEMEPEEYQLQEIVISFENADNLVQKAFFNLTKNYFKAEPINYLWHGRLTEINSKAKKESYALYSASVCKTNLTKRETSFKLKLIDLNHKVSSNIQQSNIIRKNRFGTEYHPRIIDWLTDGKSHRIIKQNSENDSLIFIQCIPDQSKGKNIPPLEIIINKSDTVLLSFKVLPLKSSLEEDTGEYKKAKFLFMSVLEYKLFTYTTDLFIKKEKGAYYIDSYNSKTLISFLIDGKEELISLENMSKAVKDIKIEKSEAVNLNGNSNQLFKLKGTTTQNFWE